MSVSISEAISVSVSDRNLPTHAPPTVDDPEAFGSEPQPRLPLFHDDDYYEVDLGDDEFVIGKYSALYEVT